MVEFKYLMIGGGMTADAAIRGIRQVDPDGTIGLIGNESYPPYNRPALSKKLWKGKPLDSIWRRTPGYPQGFHLGRTVLSIHVTAKTVRDDQGELYGYDKLLLATGGTPRRLPFGPEGVIYYRSLDDYHRLRELNADKEHFGVIGGGFIGSEIAAALSMNGKKVTMFFPGVGIGARLFPQELSVYLNEYYRGKGVEVLPQVLVRDIQVHAEGFHIILEDGRHIQVEAVIAGIGIQPNVELAQRAGLNVTDNGIFADEFLRTSQANIYTAGDVAEFYNPALDRRMRVEHEDNANTMGVQAGRNMAGANEPYHHLPYFYSDMFELGYEAIGELDPRLETFADWKEPYQEGVVYYLQAGRLRGVLLWNVWEKVPVARQLIAEPGPFSPAALKGRL